LFTQLKKNNKGVDESIGLDLRGRGFKGKNHKHKTNNFSLANTVREKGRLGELCLPRGQHKPQEKQLMRKRVDG